MREEAGGRSRKQELLLVLFRLLRPATCPCLLLPHPSAFIPTYARVVQQAGDDSFKNCTVQVRILSRVPKLSINTARVAQRQRRLT